MNDRFYADDLSRKSGLAPRSFDLAHMSAFNLGPVEVRPPSRELIAGDRRELVEPLVMQVLVALHSAKSATLSRDDLIDACWGGRAVSDDAISRVASRLRSLGKSLGGFEVETIPKIGYRLIVRDEPRSNGRVTDPRRRNFITASAAIVAAGIGGGFWAWRRTIRPPLSPHAEQLLQKGLTTLQNNDIIEAPDPGTSLQAIAFLTELTEVAPKFATGWGALALAYSVRKRAVPPAERPGYDARGRAAAKAALDLDPREPRGIAALRLLEPMYRRWAVVERGNRAAYKKRPDVAILPALMSNFYGNVGRWKEAARYTRSIDRSSFVIPGVEWRLLNDLWGSGDLPAADNQLEAAVKRWPQHARVWRARVAYLMYSGRAAEVLRLMDQPADIPVELNADYLATVRETARALVGQRPGPDALARNLDYLRMHPAAALDVAQACVALGDPETAFEIFEGYYFGRGPWASATPLGGDEDRYTSPLFQPVMRPIWKSPIFAPLLRRIGLEDYWEQSGTTPDFRAA